MAFGQASWKDGVDGAPVSRKSSKNIGVVAMDAANNSDMFCTFTEGDGDTIDGNRVDNLGILSLYSSRRG